MRRMSFAMTTEQVVARTKTVTRRLGWGFLKPGDLLLAVDKLRTKNARKLAVIEVVGIRSEPLDRITYADVAKEGVYIPDCSIHSPEVEANCPYCFIGIFCIAMKCDADQIVNRIEFRYVDAGGDLRMK